MKILIEVDDAQECDDLVALINGSAAATGKKHPKIVIVENTALSRSFVRAKDAPSIGYAFDTFLLPVGKIDSIVLDQPVGTANLALMIDPREYAILNTLLQKNLGQRPKAPF